MKSVTKQRCLIGALAMGMLGSASAATLLVEVTSSQPGLGSGNGCTLSGAIASARKNQALYGCQLNYGSSAIYGDAPIVWADKSKVTAHHLQKTQALDFPIKISLDAKYDSASQQVLFGHGWINNGTNPPVYVDAGMRHFNIDGTSKNKNLTVTLEGMSLTGARLPGLENIDTQIYEEKAILLTSGGSVIIHSEAKAVFNRLRFVDNTSDNVITCFSSFPKESYSKSYGSALSLVNAKASLSDVDFLNNTAGVDTLVANCPFTTKYLSYGTLYIQDSSASLSRTRFVANEADYGAAIYAAKSSLWIDEVEMEGNRPRFVRTQPPKEDIPTPQGLSVMSLINSDARVNYLNISNNYSAALVVDGNDYEKEPNYVDVRKSSFSNNGLAAIIYSDARMFVINSLIHGNMNRMFPLDQYINIYSFYPGVDDPGVVTQYPNAAIYVQSTRMDDPNDNQDNVFLSFSHSTISDNYGDHAVYVSQRMFEELPKQNYVYLASNILSHHDGHWTCEETGITMGGIGYIDTSNAIVSLGNNLENNDNNCNFDMNNNDKVGTDPILTGLSIAPQVGPTNFVDMPVNRPGNNSPALSHIKYCLATEDQIDNPRNYKQACDAGAIEILDHE